MYGIQQLWSPFLRDLQRLWIWKSSAAQFRLKVKGYNENRGDWSMSGLGRHLSLPAISGLLRVVFLVWPGLGFLPAWWPQDRAAIGWLKASPVSVPASKAETATSFPAESPKPHSVTFITVYWFPASHRIQESDFMSCWVRSYIVEEHEQ